MAQSLKQLLKVETLPPVTWLNSAIFLFVIYYVSTSIRAYWRLRHFKGPWLASWSDIWRFNALMSRQAHLRWSEACTKYGKTVRIAPDVLLTCDEELFRKMNSGRSGYYKPPFYQAFRFDAEEDNLLSEIDTQRHAAMRRKFAPGYYSEKNVKLEPDMDEVIWQLIRSWKSRYLSKSDACKPMDLSAQMDFLTLDIILSISLGETFGFVATDSDVYEYRATMHTNFPIMNFMSAIPLLAKISRQTWFARAFGPKAQDRIGLGKIKGVASNIIAKRFAAADEDQIRGEDMTQNFVRSGATKNEITDNVMLQIIAGSDTSATVVKNGLLWINSNPRISGKLRAEADQANVSFQEIISSKRAMELPYLVACVKEALRFHQAATGLLSRVVPPQGDYYDGKFIPGGTTIAPCFWNLTRLNFDAYGADADVFRPERWLDASPERLARMEKAHELCFGYGDWKCLGYRVALIEIHKILFELTRRFDFGIINPKQPYDQDHNYGLFMQKGLWVRVEERE